MTQKKAELIRTIYRWYRIIGITINALFYGSVVAMIFAIGIAIFLLVRSHLRYSDKDENKDTDELFSKIIKSNDKAECWTLVRDHVGHTTRDDLNFVSQSYKEMTTAFFNEDYRTLKSTLSKLNERRKNIKRQRRKQIIALRQTDTIISVEKGTWFFLVNNSLSQMIYCMKRMGEPCREHVGNNFTPVPSEYVNSFMAYRDEIERILTREYSVDNADQIREDAAKIQKSISNFRKELIVDIQTKQLYIETMTVFLNVVQESQELLSALRHAMRGMSKFEE